MCNICMGSRGILCPHCGGANCSECNYTGEIDCPRCKRESEATIAFLVCCFKIIAIIVALSFVIGIIGAVVDWTQDTFNIGATKWTGEIPNNSLKNAQMSLLLKKNEKGEITFVYELPDKADKLKVTQKINYKEKNGGYTIYFNKNESLGYAWTPVGNSGLTFYRLVTKKNHKEKTDNQINGIYFSNIFRNVVLHKEK